MALSILQIGNLVLPENKTSVSQSYSNKMRGKVSDSLSSPNMYARNTRFLYSEREVSVEIYLTNTTHLTGEETEQILRSYVGVQLPIIAYELPINSFETYRGNSGCNGCDTKDCCLLFLQTVGVISNVGEAEEDDWASPRTLSIDITLMSFWRGLDNTFWRYDDFGFNEKNKPYSGTDYEFYDVPDCGVFLGDTEKDSKAFLARTYQDYMFMFTHDYMNDSIYRNTTCYSGKCKNNKFLDGQVFAKRNQKHNIQVDIKTWGAPPLPIVILDSVTGTGDITIKNSWQEAGVYNVERSTIVDVLETNAILQDNSIDDLDANDKIILGDFTYTTSDGTVLRNAMIVRDGTALIIQPVVRYPDFYPCMITPSTSAYGNSKFVIMSITNSSTSNEPAAIEATVISTPAAGGTSRMDRLNNLQK